MNETERRARIAQLKGEIAERVAEMARLAVGDLPLAATANPSDFAGVDDLRDFCQGDLDQATARRLWRILVRSWHSSEKPGEVSLDIRARDTLNPASPTSYKYQEYDYLVASKESLKAVAATVFIGCVRGFGKTSYDLLTAWVAQL